MQTAAIKSKDMKCNKKPVWQNHRHFCNLAILQLKIKGRAQEYRVIMGKVKEKKKSDATSKGHTKGLKNNFPYNNVISKGKTKKKACPMHKQTMFNVFP